MGTIHNENPFLDHVNSEVEEWRKGFARIRLSLRPHHLNRAGVAHGGLIATLIDHAGGFCGLYCTVPGNRRYGMTLSLTCNFLAQSNSGTLIASGEVIKNGRKIYFSRTEVQTEAGVLIASGLSTHRYRSGSESPAGVPPMIFKDTTPHVEVPNKTHGPRQGGER